MAEDQAGGGQHRRGLAHQGGRQPRVRPGRGEDLLLPGGPDLAKRHPGRLVGIAGDEARVHRFVVQPGQDHVAARIAAHARDQGHPCAEARGRHGLVRSLSTHRLLEGIAVDGLPGPRQARPAHQVVDVGFADDHDVVHGATLRCLAAQRYAWGGPVVRTQQRGR